MQRTKGVLREFALMLLEGGFSFRMPNLSLVMGKILPSETDYLGEGAVVRLNLCRYVLTFDERGTKEDERIGRSWDMIFRFPLTMTWTTGSSSR
jgi:hypothetical protein